jgi:hypothetical protein
MSADTAGEDFGVNMLMQGICVFIKVDSFPKLILKKSGHDLVNSPEDKWSVEEVKAGHFERESFLRISH